MLRILLSAASLLVLGSGLVIKESETSSNPVSLTFVNVCKAPVEVRHPLALILMPHSFCIPA